MDNKDSIKKLLSNERKYDSIIDESRRNYQNGRIINFKILNDQKIFDIALKFSMKLFMSDEIKIDNIFSGMKLKGDSKGENRIEVIAYSNNSKRKILTVKTYDSNKTQLFTTIEIIKPSFFNKASRLQYVEKYKFEKFLYGLSDVYKKILLKKRIMYKSAILSQKICQKLDIKIDDKSINIINKVNKKGYIGF